VETTQVGNEGYRYGFNGKELDKETSSTTTYDYGFRIYSPGLGRFLSVDPLTKSYPWLTPYQFAGNSPIRFIDLDGLEVANPSIFRTAWNAITGDFHLNRMNSYLTENKLSSENVIELNNETSVVYQVQKNAATGTNQTIYSVFRKARQGRDCLFCGQSGKDDDIGLTENEFLNTTVLSAHILDAPIGLGGASKIGAVINGSKNSYYSFRETVGTVRQGLRELGSWRTEIGIGVPDVLGSSGDALTKGFHLHFHNLGGLELGLSSENGQLVLKWLRRGNASLAKQGVKLFSRAIENNEFRARLISKLKGYEDALMDATKVLNSGSRDLKDAEKSLNEVRNVMTTITKNYGTK